MNKPAAGVALLVCLVASQAAAQLLPAEGAEPAPRIKSPAPPAAIALPKASEPPSEPPPERWLPLRVRARKQILLRLPGDLPTLAGYRASRHSLKLLDVAEEGRRVKRGEELARFDFPRERLDSRVQRRLMLAQSEALRQDATMAERQQQLAGELALVRIEAEKAELDKQKKNVLSKRDSELVELAARRARFEVEALERRVRAHEQLRQAVAALGAEHVRQAQMVLADLADLDAAHRLKAPRSGTLRRLRARPGERMACGGVLAKLEVDGTLELVGSLTRRQAQALAPGQTIRLRRGLEGRLFDGSLRQLQVRPGRATVRAVIEVAKARLKAGQFWEMRLPEELVGPLRQDAWERAEQEGRVSALYAPELSGRPELRISWLAPHGPVKVGETLLRFDPQPPTVALRQARDKEALAQVQLDRRLADQGLERLRLEMDQTRRLLALEQAKLLALPGVGLRGSLDQKRARLDLRAAELAAAQAQALAAAFELRAGAELELEKLKLLRCEEEVELARRNLDALSMSAPQSGLLHCPRLKVGQVVQAGQRLCLLASPGEEGS